ncbi:hypothetical protein BSPWISOXPB_2683 [uncultured Gammaproteobacteria bacterium]|nr:hypothetical protein BSPWISOXPB_2630 [uncultured Gammaproteobacteria bacterium]VVM22931.1 hypothetical protein BSPWISOXPB_2661 [uncultured Gammaproteobacteria bacterium]VVM23506.1 hypothetical protein BSPWISOXPB_2560 [uncultured Gammaproteobacteria bacterium]VVM24583.1 hypothetical protein BSPWISOXPB_2683 [uncultured Gammaproteobacteria bacterium]
MLCLRIINPNFLIANTLMVGKSQIPLIRKSYQVNPLKTIADNLTKAANIYKSLVITQR